jgi:TetR/AcrR family transcriptional repressor of lmrAB and yxaGH operons
MPDPRANILLAMATLIEKQGYHATGLNDIIALSGSPKGSVYYYFPEGKEQIGIEAVRESGELIASRLKALLGEGRKPSEAIPFFLELLAENMEETEFTAGSPLTTIAVETFLTSPALNQACRQAFDQIRNVLHDLFLANSYSEEMADELSLFVLILVEGAIVLSRTYHSVAPVQLIAKEFRAILE